MKDTEAFIDTNGANVFCFLSFLSTSPLPPATTAVFDYCLSSLYSYLTLRRRCGLAYPYDWRGSMGAIKKTSVGFLFNSSMIDTVRDSGAFSRTASP